jgi:hypothetical protein
VPDGLIQLSLVTYSTANDRVGDEFALAVDTITPREQIITLRRTQSTSLQSKISSLHSAGCHLLKAHP